MDVKYREITIDELFDNNITDKQKSKFSSYMHNKIYKSFLFSPSYIIFAKIFKLKNKIPYNIKHDFEHHMDHKLTHIQNYNGYKLYTTDDRREEVKYISLIITNNFEYKISHILPISKNKHKKLMSGKASNFRDTDTNIHLLIHKEIIELENTEIDYIINICSKITSESFDSSEFYRFFDTLYYSLRDKLLENYRTKNIDILLDDIIIKKDNKLQCKICYNNDINCVLINCGHTICENCTTIIKKIINNKSIYECPFCRHHNDHFVKFFVC